MSGYGYREAVLQLDAALWRKRVIFDAESAEGRAAADAHQVPIELIGVVAARIAEVSVDLVIAAAEIIAAYMAAGESVVSRTELKRSGRRSGYAIGTREEHLLLRYLADRGHVERTNDRDLIRPVRGDEMPPG
jgi:hypothetical protein